MNKFHVEQAIVECNEKIRKYRTVLRILQSPIMEEVCDEFQEEDLEIIANAVRVGDYFELKRLLQRHMHEDLANLPTRKLRQIARSYGIIHYYRKTKVELLQDIVHVRKLRNERVGRQDSTIAQGNGEVNA